MKKMPKAKNPMPRTVKLDSDVAKVFADSRSVNNALRRLIEAARQSIKEAKRASRRMAS